MHTEMLLPATYVNDPGGFDFKMSNNGLASVNPLKAVNYMRRQDTTPPANGFLPGPYGSHVHSGLHDYGNGRFIMGNPTLTGIIQLVRLAFVVNQWGWGPQTFLRLWTHGVFFEYGPGGFTGTTTLVSYPPDHQFDWLLKWLDLTVNPFTLVAWATAEITGVNAGFRLYSPFNGPSIDQLYIEIVYSRTMPVVTTQAASAVMSTSATLNGQLSDDGDEPCNLFFEWGPTVALGSVVACGTGTTGTSFSAAISGLAVGQQYYFRARATNVVGTAYGSVLSLTSPVPPGALPAVETLPPSVVTGSQAVMNGVVTDSLAQYGEIRFQWGGTSDYGNDTPWQTGFYTGDQFSHRLVNLHEGTVYHYRAQFRLGSAIVSGSDMATAILSELGPPTWVDEETISKLEG